MYHTGIPACDAMVRLHLQGNIIPQAWYKTILKNDLQSPKPYLLAIVILSDIVYWYRPSEVRNEDTGEVEGYRKKFAADLLQRNYKQLSRSFGCSEGQAKAAVVHLEKMGIICRVFRNIEVSGNVYSNQMYIDLNVQRLRELTYPSGEISPEGGGNFDGGVLESNRRGGGETAAPPVKNPQYTDTTSANTSDTTTEITPSFQDGDGRTEAEADAKACLEQTHQLSKAYCDDLPQMTMAIQRLTEFDFRLENGFSLTKDARENRRMVAFRLMVPCLAEMCCVSGPQRYCDGMTDRYAVVDQINRILQDAYGSLSDFCETLIETYLDAMDNNAIKDPRRYLKAMIWDWLLKYPENLDLL